MIIEDSKLHIKGVAHDVSPCQCGETLVYLHHSCGKYQLKCFLDMSCKLRTGLHDSVLEALNMWNKGSVIK